MVCDSCLAAAGEEWADYASDDDFDPEMADSIAIELGADIADHNCSDLASCMCAYAVENRRPTRRARR